MKTILDNADVSIISTDPQGMIQTFNTTAQRMLGYRADEVVGKATPVILHDPEEVRRRADELTLEMGRVFEPGFEVFVARARAGDPEAREWTYIRKDGSRFPVRLIVTAMFDAEGILTGFMGIAADLTHHRRDDERFRLVVESSPNGIVMVNEAGVITLINAPTEAMFGYSRAELIGLQVEDLVPWRFRSAHPVHRARFFANPSVRAMGAGRDLFGLRKDGSEVPIEIGLSPIVTGEGNFVLATIVDISERKRMEEALRRAYSDLEDKILERTVELQEANVALLDKDQRIRLATEATEVGIWEWNVITNKILWDVQMFRIYGIPPTSDGFVDYTEWSGAVFTEDLSQQEEILHDTVRRLGSSRREFRIRRRNDGEYRIIHAVETVRTNAQGQVEWVVGTNLDITERRRAEEAIRRAHDELETKVFARTAELKVAKERAESADRIKSAFLATMSHELRTPLNSIIGFTGIILQGLAGPLNQEQTRQLEMVRSSSRHLLELINDVLDISKIEAGELTVSSEPFDLCASITKIADIVRPLAVRKGLALRVELPPPFGPLVSDQRRVEQVLLNLLNNAIKFTEFGEVALTVVTTPEVVSIRIADTGIGISKEDIATVFLPFRQLDTGLSRNHEGTGLGLAICRRLADLMGGKVYAESELGKGSVFTFTLPLKGQVKP